ncbi:MAG: autotransporter-associated beta strand repeat-containing protein [Chthoniobacter sp.]
MGSGVLNITKPQAGTTTAQATVSAGTLNISGAGTYTGLTAQGILINDGATFNLQDTGTAIVNRLGGGKMTIQGGTFNYTVNPTAPSSETLGALSFVNGLSTINVDNSVGGQASTLGFTTSTFNTGSSVIFTGALGTPTNKITFTTNPGMTGGLIPRAVVMNGGNFDFATYNSDGKTANTNGIQAFATYNLTNNMGLALAADTMKITANAGIFASRTLNALAISGDGLTVTGVPGSTLTLTSGGVLVTGGTNTINVPILAFGGVEGQFHINAGSTLLLGSAVTGTVGLNVSDGGTLALTAPQYYTGLTLLNSGTMKLLAGSTNSLVANQRFFLNGGTLDLNGSTQYVADFTSVSAISGSAGTLTSTAPAELTTTSTTSVSFGGQITNNVTFNKGGSNTETLTGANSYTGATVVNGGTLLITDSGTLSGTSSIEIDNAILSIANNGTMDNTNRINNSAPITMNEGSLNFTGRAQTDASESVGAVTLRSGLNVFTVTPGGTGVNSATLTLADLQHGAMGSTDVQTQASKDAMVNFVAPNNVAQAFGVLGSSNPRLLISSYTTNQAFMGPWAIVTTSTNTAEFAGYDKVLGVGALNAPGYAGYGATVIDPTVDQSALNVRLTTSGSLADQFGSVIKLNSLNLFGNVNFTFADASDTIDLVSGGLLKSGAFGNTFGSDHGQGNLTAGTGADTDLYVYSQQGNFTLNPSIVDNGSGKIRLVIGGTSGLVTLGGFNTYTGGTVIDGIAVAVLNYLPAGDVTVNNGSVTASAGNRTSNDESDPFGNGLDTAGIDHRNTVTLNNGTFNFSGGTDQITNLTGLSLNTTGAATTTVNLSTTTTVLTLSGAITASPTSVGTLAAAATISGTGSLSFGTADSPINAFPITVDRTLVGGFDVAPLQAGLVIAVPILHGGIAKQGLGVLQLNSTASTFAGGVDLQSGSLIIGNSSVPASGTVVSGPLGTGALTIHNGTTLLSGVTAGVGVGNNYFIQGANAESTASSFTFQGANSLQLNGTLTISAATPLVKELDISVVNPAMTATLGGTIDMRVNNIVKSGLGTLVINPSYTGSITVSSGPISLFADGDGTSAPQLINFNDLTVTQPTAINVGRLGTTYLPNFTLAANKTIVLRSLTTNGNAISVNNPGVAAGAGNGGYGLQVNGAMALVADQTFNVSTATASNVTQGLTLAGEVSGAFNLIKGGNGTLVLNSPVATISGTTTDGSSTVTVGSTTGLTVGQTVSGTGLPAGEYITFIVDATHFTVSTGTGVTAATGSTLTYAGNVFGGAGNSIDIQGGVVSIGKDSDLGNPNNVVNLDVLGTQTTLFGLRATSDVNLASTRIINLGQANNGLEAVFGATLTINSAFTFNGGAPTAALFKNDDGVVAINANNSGWAGAITINSGALRALNDNAFGTSTITIGSATGAALQLAGGVTISNPFSNGAATSSGINNGGVIESVSGVNTYAGLITDTSGAAATFGADAGATLNIAGGIASPGGNSVSFSGAGNINITTTGISTGSTFNMVGSGVLTVSVANPGMAAGTTINTTAGTMKLIGAGTLGPAGTSTGAVLVDEGGTLTIDNSTANGSSNVNNRLGTTRPITFRGGAFNLTGNETVATTETFAAPSFAVGPTVITVTSVGQATTLKFTSQSSNAAPAQSSAAATGASVIFRVVGTGASISDSGGSGILFNGGTGATGTVGKAIMPWALFDNTANGGTISFATGDAAAGATGTTASLRGLNATTEYLAANTIAAADNILLNSAVPLSVAANISVNSITMDGDASIALGKSVFLANSSGGILVRTGSSSISGGVVNQLNSSSPLNIWTLGDLTISSYLNGGNGFGTGNSSLIKAGGGTLTLSPLANYIYGNSGNTMVGQTIVNGGTLKLNGGTNTLYYDGFLQISPGATVDLNGNSQYVEALFTTGAVADTSGGTVTGDALTNSTLIANYDNTTRNFSGKLTGALSFERAGQNTISFYSNSDYTGITQISGGVTILRDNAQLSKTSAINLNYATLMADNNVGLYDSPDRINNNAAINLQGGSLTLVGRAQTASSEKLGVVTALQGYSTILATSGGGTGPNSMDVTLQQIIQGNIDAVLNFNGTGGSAQLGSIGNNPRIEITDVSNLSNLSTTHIIGGWAVVGGSEFAAYNSTYGVGALTQTGFAGYDFNQGTIPLNIQPTQNLRLTAANNIPDSGLMVNALSLRGTFDTGFATATDVLNVVSGGLIANETSTPNKLGAAVDSGRLTAGGAQASGIAPLYFYNTANSYILNARVIDTATPLNQGSQATGAHVRLIISASGGTVVLTDPNNSYTGGTVLNGGTLNLAATASFPGVVIPYSDPSSIDSTLSNSGLIINGGTVTEQFTAGQIDFRNIVTLNGSATLNLLGNTNTDSGRLDASLNTSAAATNTLASLVFNDSGGSANPVVNSGTGTFTVPFQATTITLSAPGVLLLTGDANHVAITSNPTNVGSIATVAGRVDFGTSRQTIMVNPYSFNVDDVAPIQAGLNIQGIINSSGGILKTGDGVLGMAAQQIYTGETEVLAGTVAVTVANGGSRFSDYQLDDNGKFNTNALSTAIGSLSGSGTVFNSSGVTNSTLQIGFDNTDTTFSGQFSRYSDASANTTGAGNLFIQKIGTGTLNLTGTTNLNTADLGAAATGQGLTVNQGTVSYNGAGTGAFLNYTVNAGGVLVLDNSGTNEH